jgi:hypothetical protein
MFRVLLSITLILNLAASLVAQDIFLTPYQSLTRDTPIKVVAMTFFTAGKYVAVVDEKGAISIWDVADRSMVKQRSADEKVLYTSFIGQDNKFVVVMAAVPYTNIPPVTSVAFVRQGCRPGWCWLTSILPGKHWYSTRGTTTSSASI